MRRSHPLALLTAPLFSVAIASSSLATATPARRFSNITPSTGTEGERTNIIASAFARRVEFHSSEKDCLDVERKIRTLLLDDLDLRHMYTAWIMRCSAQDGVPVAASLDLVIEPKTDTDRDLFDRYVATHEGLDFFGTPVRFAPIVGVFNLLRIKAAQWSKESDETGAYMTLHESYDERRLSPNLRDAWQVDFDLEDAWGQDGFDAEATLKFVGNYFGINLRTKYHDDLLKRANRLIFSMRKTVLLHDGQFFEVGFDPSYHEIVPQK